MTAEPEASARHSASSILPRPVEEGAGATGELLRVQNLARVFDVSKPLLNRVLERLPRRSLTAVADVSFSIRKGETFAIVGESGSGKSTVAKMIVGLLVPTKGRVVFDGVDMATARSFGSDRALRRRITMIFQDPYASLNPRMTAAAIIAEPIRASASNLSGREVSERVDMLLSQVRMSPRDGTRYPHEFSGGQRQRIAIARALASSPDFIVCDEPTSALDVSVQAQILNLMRDLQDQLGLTYLLISHNLAVVRHMAASIGVMYLGRLVETAPCRELFASPRHPYTRMLLDAVPDFTMSGRTRMPVHGEIPNPIAPPTGCAFHPRCPLALERCSLERPAERTSGSASVSCHVAEPG
jgi:peptide/nickel transport system ATP-binding protein